MIVRSVGCSPASGYIARQVAASRFHCGSGYRRWPNRAAQEHSDPRHGVGVVVGRPEDERTPGGADQPDLGRHDKRDAQYKENGGDREPDRSPQTKLRGTRGGFATSSPDEEKPLGAAWNPPLPRCPNHTKSGQRQREATGDEEGSTNYHSGNLPGFLNFSDWAA
jgi:hypothetical protein